MQILLVESSPVSQIALSALLEREGHQVTAVSDHREALSVFRADPGMAAVIVGLGTEAPSGLALVREIRMFAAEDRFTYVIAMSVREDRETVAAALDCGANDFIRKPVCAAELQARLRAAERFAATQRQLLEAAMTDPLTGLLNRRALGRRVGPLLQGAAVSQISLIALDIDQFKSINDRYGHAVGDRVICAVADAARASANLVARMGGEEFLIVRVGEGPAESLEFAEALRRRIADLVFTAGSAEFGITCSFGVQTVDPGMSLDAVIHGADLALYEAKAAGRNRVAMSPRANAETVSGIRAA